MIQVTFKGISRMRLPVSSLCTTWRQVGHVAVCIKPVVIEIVQHRQQSAGIISRSYAQASISAAVQDCFVFYKENFTFFGDTGGIFHIHAMPGTAVIPDFFQVKKHLDRLSGYFGKGYGCNIQAADINFTSETAANIGEYYTHIAFLHVKYPGNVMLQVVSRLMRRVNGYSFTFPIGDCAMRFDKSVDGTLALQAVSAYIIRLFLGFLNIPELQVDLGVYIARIFLKDLRRIFFGRFSRSKHRRQHFVFYFDQLQGFIESFFIYRTDCANFISIISDFVDAKNIFIVPGGAKAIFNRGHILGSNNGPYAGQFFRFRSINLNNARMSLGAANKLTIKHIGKLEIRGKLAATGHFIQYIGSL